LNPWTLFYNQIGEEPENLARTFNPTTILMNIKA